MITRYLKNEKNQQKATSMEATEIFCVGKDFLKTTIYLSVKKVLHS